MNKAKGYGVVVLWMLAGLVVAGPVDAERLVIEGAGTSTMVVREFFAEFSKEPEAKGYEFEVPLASIKHSGGVSAAEKTLFGRTGRPLSDAEKAGHKKEIILAHIPISFVVGRDVTVDSLSKDQMERVYTGKVRNWSEVGGPNAPIVLAGREPTESAMSVLRKAYPFFEKAKFDVVFLKDPEMIKYFRAQPDESGRSLGFGAAPNFHGLKVIKTPGLSAGLDVGLVYDTKNENHPLVKAVRRFAGTQKWKKIAAETVSKPVE